MVPMSAWPGSWRVAWAVQWQSWYRLSCENGHETSLEGEGELSTISSRSTPQLPYCAFFALTIVHDRGACSDDARAARQASSVASGPRS
jgi:hypothetical protein